MTTINFDLTRSLIKLGQIQTKCCDEDDLATFMYAVIINNRNVVPILVQKGIGVMHEKES